MAQDVEAAIQEQTKQSAYLQAKCLSDTSSPANISDTEIEFCPRVWDTILCWPPTRAGTLAIQSCPAYIAGFVPQGLATRQCMDNGEWYKDPLQNRSWTNYTQCFTDPVATVALNITDIGNNNHLISEYMPVLKTMSQVGYAVSLTTLLVAFCILATIKKLRCPRNMLHLHLFVSFIMRAFMTLLKDIIFVSGVGLPQDVVEKNGSVYFYNQENNWLCKAVVSTWQYSIMANYCWILMEGLYLHNLIFLALFSDNSSITLYVVLGWGLPALFVVPWIIYRALLEDHYCWTTNSSQVFLLIRLPTAFSVVLSFLLFLNIVRVLLLKLRASVCDETRTYRRWFKSTLVLVPLFGVHYTLFLGMSYSIGVDPRVEIAWLFCDQFFASFQGFFVAVLYCFVNGEVRQELKRQWPRRLSGFSGRCGRAFFCRPLRPARCYSSTSCTSLSMGAAPGPGMLNRKTRQSTDMGAGKRLSTSFVSTCAPNIGCEEGSRWYNSDCGSVPGCHIEMSHVTAH